jgi:hypothetical protein
MTITSRRMIWVGYPAGMENEKCLQSFDGKASKKKERIRQRKENNIKI